MVFETPSKRAVSPNGAIRVPSIMASIRARSTEAGSPLCEAGSIRAVRMSARAGGNPPLNSANGFQQLGV